jgi:hypothetical protein
MVVDKAHDPAPRNRFLELINTEPQGRLAMSLVGILLGIINIAIVVAILVLVGLVIVWFLSWLNFPVPANIQKVYMVIVALIALAMFVALLLGSPLPFHVISVR